MARAVLGHYDGGMPHLNRTAKASVWSQGERFCYRSSDFQGPCAWVAHGTERRASTA